MMANLKATANPSVNGPEIKVGKNPRPVRKAASAGLSCASVLLPRRDCTGLYPSKEAKSTETGGNPAILSAALFDTPRDAIAALIWVVFEAM